MQLDDLEVAAPESKGATTDSLNELAVGLKLKGQFEAALIVIKRAIAIEPERAGLWNNLGGLLLDMKQYGQAHVALNKALSLDPTFPPVYGNLAQLHAAYGQRDVAEGLSNTALKLKDDYVLARWNRALVRLENGDWEAGLPEYECRFQYLGSPTYRKFPVPYWEGQDLNHKTLFVSNEQGVGDTVLFSRYVPWLKKKYPKCKILFGLDPGLWNLLHSFQEDGICQFLMPGTPWPKEIDYATYLMSLPLRHGSTPSNVPAEPGRISKRVKTAQRYCGVTLPAIQGAGKDTLRIGICWAGNPTQLQNHMRSIPVQLIARLAEDPRISLYSLQVGAHADDPLKHGLDSLICPKIPFDDDPWVSTALAIQQCHAVVTVCTSVAHVASSLGKPTYVALMHDPYWVWLRNRSDSVWYNSTRLYEQKAPGQWDEVLERIKKDLFS